MLRMYSEDKGSRFFVDWERSRGDKRGNDVVARSFRFESSITFELFRLRS